jgi:hypothetical protein
MQITDSGAVSSKKKYTRIIIKYEIFMKSLKIDYLLLVLSVREKMIQTPNEG